MSDSPSDADLLSAARDDPEAFGIFYRRHVDAVMRYLRSRVRDTEAAADLTAEVFAAALVGLGRYRSADGPDRAWLFAIANHKLVDWQRRRGAAARARRRLGMPVRTFGEEALLRLAESLDARPLGLQLLGLVDDLPPSERAAVLARVINEQSMTSSRRGSAARSPRRASVLVAGWHASNEASHRSSHERGLPRNRGRSDAGGGGTFDAHNSICVLWHPDRGGVAGAACGRADSSQSPATLVLAASGRRATVAAIVKRGVNRVTVDGASGRSTIRVTDGFVYAAKPPFTVRWTDPDGTRNVVATPSADVASAILEPAG